MRRRPDLREGLSRLLDTHYPHLFLLGGVLIGMLPNGIYELGVGLLGGGLAARIAAVAIPLGLLLLLAYALSILEGRRERGSTFTIVGCPAAPRKRGLICLVSNRDVIDAAVKYHARKLEHLWLIASSRTSEMAETLKAEYRDEQKTGDVQTHIIVLTNDDIYSHEATEAQVERIYSDLPEGFAQDDVIADFTGGTKSMTAGMIMACLDADRPLEYVPQKYRTASDGRPIPAETGDPIHIGISRA